MPDLTFRVRDRAGAMSVTVVAASVSSAPDPTDPAAWGYRPPVPAGWTLIEGQNPIQLPLGASKRYYRNCVGPVWLKEPSEDLIFVDCDMSGGQCGTQGRRISFYGCKFGNVTNLDGMQVKPAASGAVRPSGWLFQGCSFKDIFRTTSFHSDSIQFGGVLDMTVRHCHFDRTAVEDILTNDWNGVAERVLVEGCYFGNRFDAGGPPVKFAGTSRDCHAVGNFYDGSFFSYPTAVNCTYEGTRPRSEWTHGDPWDTY